MLHNSQQKEDWKWKGEVLDPSQLAPIFETTRPPPQVKCGRVTWKRSSFYLLMDELVENGGELSWFQVICYDKLEHAGVFFVLLTTVQSIFERLAMSERFRSGRFTKEQSFSRAYQSQRGDRKQLTNSGEQWRHEQNNTYTTL